MNVEASTKVAILVARAFEAAGIPYALVGSMASSVHGEPRATMDVDFAALIRSKQVDPLIAELSPSFAADREWIREAVARGQIFQLVHLDTYVKVDVYVRLEQALDVSQILRAQRTKLGANSGDVINIASAEDTVLQKLLWYRSGDCVSDRQWRDVIGVLKLKGAALDRVYMFESAAALGVADLLQRALEQARI